MRTAHIIATGVLWGVAMFINDAYATPSEGDLKNFVRVYVQTKKCMRSAGTAAYMRGDGAERTQYFMLSVCATPLYTMLRRDMPEEAAQDNLLRIARTSYFEDVLQSTEPPITRK